MDMGVVIGGALALGVGIMVYRSGRKSGCGCGCGCHGETMEDEIYEENDEDRGCCDDDD